MAMPKYIDEFMFKKIYFKIILYHHSVITCSIGNNYKFPISNANSEKERHKALNA